VVIIADDENSNDELVESITATDVKCQYNRNKHNISSLRATSSGVQWKQDRSGINSIDSRDVGEGVMVGKWEELCWMVCIDWWRLCGHEYRRWVIDSGKQRGVC